MLAALTAIVFLTLFLICFSFRNNFVEVFSIVTTSFSCYAFMATFFIAMSVAGGESSRGTMPFLQSMPVPMWQAAAAKLLLAALTLVVPLLLVMAFIYLPFLLGAGENESVQQAIAWDHRHTGHPWGIEDWFTSRLVGTVLGTLSMLLWLAAVGVNRSDEIRAGAVGFLTVAVIWMCVACLFHFAEKNELPDFEEGLRVAMASAPGGPGFAASKADNRLPYVLTALVGHALVGAWFLGRFGRVKHKPKRGGSGQSTAELGYALGRPMRSQLSATAWKQMRETGPLALVALTATVGFATLVYFSADTDNIREGYGILIMGIGAYMTFFVVIVAGIGLYLEELKPGLNNFLAVAADRIESLVWRQICCGLAGAVRTPRYSDLLGGIR